MEYAPTDGDSMYYNARPNGNGAVAEAKAIQSKESEEVDK